MEFFQGQKCKAELTDIQNANTWMRDLGEQIDLNEPDITF